MRGGPGDFDPMFQRYHDYLLILAEARLHPRLRRRIDPADLVQEVYLKAHGGNDGYRGDEGGRLDWLRVILGNALIDAIRKYTRQKGDVRREVSLEPEVEESSFRAGDLLAADQSTPSQQAQRSEQTALLADALVQLPKAQREAIVLQKLQGYSLGEIATSMKRSQTAVAGLIKRGLQKLRELMKAEE